MLGADGRIYLSLKQYEHLDPSLEAFRAGGVADDFFFFFLLSEDTCSAFVISVLFQPKFARDFYLFKPTIQRVNAI